MKAIYFFETVLCLAAAALLAFFIVSHYANEVIVQGQQTPVRALVASEGTVSVTPYGTTLTGSNNFCATRVIGTVSTPLRVAFGTAAASSTYGHVLAASSTTAFPAEIYGCGTTTAYAIATTAVTVTTLTH